MAKGKKQVKEVNPLYMTTREVAAFLGLSAGTLCVWRNQGKGPSYTRSETRFATRLTTSRRGRTRT